MKGSFRQSMAWLHTWAGLVVGWVLFAVFVTGTASYYRADISRWMRPELTKASPLTHAELPAAAERAVAYLEKHASEARTWFIGLPHGAEPVLDLFWRIRPGAPPGHVILDARTGAEMALRKTMAGDFLYRFHFELHLPPIWGRWIVGICAMIMLVALISGIITHKRIFSDFFTFRRDKAPRRSFLDAHNVTGVLALPYHLMITYTGIVTLSLMYMPWGVTTAYRGDSQAYFSEAGFVTTSRPVANRPAPPARSARWSSGRSRPFRSGWAACRSLITAMPMPPSSQRSRSRTDSPRTSPDRLRRRDRRGAGGRQWWPETRG